MRSGRAVVLVTIIAVVHLATMLTLGVLAFSSQGDLDRPHPPSLLHRALAGVVTVLEFPLVWAVRRLSPEYHSGFTPAAIGTSLVWAAAVFVGAGGVVRARRSNPDRT